MNRLLASLAVVCLGLGWGCRKPAETPATAPKQQSSPAELWLRLHFVGWKNLSASNAAPKLSQIAALPDTQKLRTETLDKLARNLPGLLFLPTNAVTTNHAALLRPLLEDLGQTETFFEMRGSGARISEGALVPSWYLALQLDDTRAKLWQTNLWQALSPAWQPENAKESPPTWLWALLNSKGKGMLSFNKIGSWVVLGYEANPRLYAGAGFHCVMQQWWKELVDKISAQGRPVEAAKDYWLAAEVNLPTLALFTPWAKLFSTWPQAQVTISGKDEYLRTIVRLQYPQPLALQYEPWRVPTSTIHEPLNSLTAVRGLAAWLGGRDEIRQLELKPVPNELFLWAQSDTPYQTFAAWPAKDASNQIPALAKRLQAKFNRQLATNLMGSFIHETNFNQLVWQGLPLIVPALQVAPEPGDSYWAFGIFPSAIETNPLPAELIGQLNRTNLVYYDWEITELRLLQWRQLAQLPMLLPRSPAIGSFSESTGTRWMRLVAPLLGNSVTEGLLAAPAELQIVRKSHSGFTGVELLLLARWLDAPAFPRWQTGFFSSSAAEANDAPPPPAPPKP